MKLRAIAISGTILCALTACGGGGGNDDTTSTTAIAATQNTGLGTVDQSSIVPVARAGVSQDVVLGTQVTLNGGASNDPKGATLTYAWSLTSKPTNSNATLVGPTSVNPSFTPDVIGTYVASLTVSNSQSTSLPSTVSVTAAKPSTAIGGIISNDTTLTVDKSPYLITSNMQVGAGITLTVDPGVTISAKVGGISVYGTLKIAGTASSPVQLQSVSIVNAGTSPSQTSSIQISHANLNGGNLYPATGNGGYGNLVLVDSILTGVNSNGYMYLWYPTSDSYIERNVFKNSGGISTGATAPRKIYIRNNVFSNISGITISNWASYGGSTLGTGETTIVTGNSFLDTGKIILSLPNGYNSAAMTATGNYWGTTDQAIVQSRISDKTNDLGAAGYISFLPLLSAPDGTTPLLP